MLAWYFWESLFFSLFARFFGFFSYSLKLSNNAEERHGYNAGKKKDWCYRYKYSPRKRSYKKWAPWQYIGILILAAILAGLVLSGLLIDTAFAVARWLADNLNLVGITLGVITGVNLLSRIAVSKRYFFTS